MDRDPEAEVAWAEGVPLLEREHVPADVVHRVGRIVVVEHEQVVLTEDALREVPEQHTGLGAGDSPAELGATRLLTMRAPTRAVSGASRRCIDVMLASTQAARSTTSACATPGARSPVCSATRCSACSVTAAKSARNDPERYDDASGSRPAKRRATFAASPQSMGSALPDVEGVDGVAATAEVTVTAAAAGGSPGAWDAPS